MLTSALLMVRPAAFGFNPETANSNVFQQKIESPRIAPLALAEFDQAVSQIRASGIRVLVLEDTPDPVKPDAVFPNNWFCTLPTGELLFFPMASSNRKLEVRDDLPQFLKDHGYAIKRLIDLRSRLAPEMVLEGTGSLVFDHIHKTVFATVSSRTNEEAVRVLAKLVNYTAHIAWAESSFGEEIYHTNVLLALSPSLAVCCTDWLKPGKHKDDFLEALHKNNRKTIQISEAQARNFAANMLFVPTRHELKLIASSTAWGALTEEQRQQVSDAVTPVLLDIPTIETVGGGSARCMLAEIYLPELPK